MTELLASLDRTQGDIGLYLDGLYNYQINLLTQVNISDDIEKLDEVSSVFKGLLDAWREETNVAE